MGRFAASSSASPTSAQGRNDSSASGSLRASSLQRRLSGDESDLAGRRSPTRPVGPRLQRSVATRRAGQLETIDRAAEISGRRSCARAQRRSGGGQPRPGAMRGGAVSSSRWTRVSRTVGPLVTMGMHEAAVLRQQRPVQPQLESLVRCQIDNSCCSLILRPLAGGCIRLSPSRRRRRP